MLKKKCVQENASAAPPGAGSSFARAVSRLQYQLGLFNYPHIMSFSPLTTIPGFFVLYWVSFDTEVAARAGLYYISFDLH
jgi:hypothetical protein